MAALVWNHQFIMKNNMILANIFIIPTATVSVAEPGAERQVKILEHLFGENLAESDRLVQVWTTDQLSDNWTDHGRINIGRPGQWPGYLPYSKIKNLREGDFLDVIWEGSMIRLTANQSDFRYRTFGTFEQCLRRI